jgi:hypothetical protein
MEKLVFSEIDINGNLVSMIKAEEGKSINGGHANIISENILINGELEEISFSLGEVVSSDGSAVARDEITKKKVKYTPAHLKAQNKYREKNRGKYNEAQRQLYEKKIQEEDWRQHYLERSRVNNKTYREKNKEALIASGQYVEKKRGRPRKLSLETKDIKDE